MRACTRPAGLAWLALGACVAAAGLLAAAAQPPNDQCANASAVGEGLFAFDTTQADTDDFVVACVGEDFTGSDVWFRYTPSQTRRVIFDTCTSDFDTIITILDDCGGLELACSNDQCGQQSRVGYDVSVGTSYVIRVAGYFGVTGSGALRIAFQPTAGNDLCASATPVGEGSFPFDTTSATTDGQASCGGTGDVWFRYTAGATGVATIQTCGADLDTVLSLYDACAGNEVACNDDACGLASRITTVVQAGSAYIVRIAGFDGAVGSGQLQISLAPPPASCVGQPPGSTPEPEPCGTSSNNGCSGPGGGFSPLPCGNTTVFGTAASNGAVRDADWYRIMLPGPATLTLTLQADFAASLRLSTGGCPATTLSIATAPTRCAELAMITAALAPGEYSIAVEMIPPVVAPCGTANNYVLTVSTSNCEPMGACCLPQGCETLSRSACTANSGTYLGDNVACASTTLDPIFISAGTPASIPDFDVDLGQPGEVTASLNINNTSITLPLAGVAVAIGLSHSGIGDLRLRLSSDRASQTLLDQVGFDGETGRDNSDLAGVYRFYDAASGDIWAAAAAAGDEQAVPPGDYQPRGPGGGGSSIGFVFSGLPLDGTWTITATDHGFAGLGTIESFALALTATISACDACAADFNGDGEVNADDLSDYITCYFTQTATPGACTAAEFNGDGEINADDLSDFITTYFAGCP